MMVYYGAITSLNGDIEEILIISKNRWEIEENFIILRSDFAAGGMYLAREDRVTVQFLTYFILLLIYRI